MTRSSDSRLLHIGPYIGLVALIELLLFAAVIGKLGWNPEGVLHISRFTARVSLFLFLLVFITSSLAYWLPGELTRNLLAHRRSLGLGFAFAHIVHLAMLISYFWISGTNPPMTTLIGGGIGYIFLSLLILTSNDAAMRELGRGGKALHKTALYYLWLVFALTYFSRLFKVVHLQPRWVYALFLSLLISALALRLATHFSRRRKPAQQAG